MTDDVALHKPHPLRAPVDERAPPFAPSMTAPMPPVLDYAFERAPAPGELIEIAPRLQWLRMPLPFALDHINLWLLDESVSHTLVDCGFGDATTREIWSTLFDSTLRGKPIARIVATHCHPDHVGNAAWLSARFGAPVAMTHAEFLTAHAIAEQHTSHGVASTIDLFRRHGMAPEHATALEARGNLYRRGVPELPDSFLRLLDGDAIPAGGVSWRIIEGHGHSPEHASLYSHELGILISGDMLLPRISTNVAVWAPNPDDDPLRRFLDSLDAFEALHPNTLVLPSHGLPFRGIAVRVAQLRTHHVARLAELADAVAAAPAPLSAADLVPVLFRRELDVQQRFFAMGEAIAHLNFLWHDGRLERRAAADGTLRFATRAR